MWSWWPPTEQRLSSGQLERWRVASPCQELSIRRPLFGFFLTKTKSVLGTLVYEERKTEDTQWRPQPDIFWQLNQYPWSQVILRLRGSCARNSRYTTISFEGQSLRCATCVRIVWRYRNWYSHPYHGCLVDVGGSSIQYGILSVSEEQRYVSKMPE